MTEAEAIATSPTGTELTSERDDANAPGGPVTEPVNESDDANTDAPAESEQSPAERIAEIEAALSMADREISRLRDVMTDLRRERDRLNASGLPGRTVTQAEAHQALVKAGQEQRRARGQQARDFRALTGGGPAPSVLTPAERVRANKPRRI